MRALALLALASAVACSAKEGDKSSVQQQADLTPNVVEVHAVDFAFHAPDTVQSGMTTFKLTNGGTTFHHVVVARLDSGKTAADVAGAMKAGAHVPWMSIVGGPNSPNPGGGVSNATVDLTPGNYVLLCFVDTPDRVPHMAKGMTKTFVVVKSSKPSAPAPAADVEITLADYKFTVSKAVAPGTHTFAVRVDSTAQMHEIELIQLAPGKTEKDLLGWMEKMAGPPPGAAVGGISSLSPGGTNYFTADLVAGNYVMICFLPDVKDPKAMPHFMKGMVQTMEVK